MLWPGAADTVLLIHDVGDDLDSWGSLPAALAGQGYRVVAIDLPGHGLSDDPWEATDAKEVLELVISSARRGQTGKSFVISVGSIAPVVGSLHADALIALSPSPSSEWSRETISTPCLIFVGGADAAAADAANRYFRGRTGWTVVSSFGTAENGAALLTSLWAAHVNEQILAFLRDYRSL